MSDWRSRWETSRGRAAGPRALAPATTADRPGRRSLGELLSGPVINLSLGGFAARLDQAVDARTPVDATLLDSHGRPIVLAVEAEVRRCRSDGFEGHAVSVAFRKRGVVAMTLARLR